MSYVQTVRREIQHTLNLNTLHCFNLYFNYRMTVVCMSAKELTDLEQCKHKFNSSLQVRFLKNKNDLEPVSWLQPQQDWYGEFLLKVSTNFRTKCKSKEKQYLLKFRVDIGWYFIPQPFETVNFVTHDS